MNSKYEKKLALMGINIKAIPFKKVTLPIIGLLSILWFIVRVVPKPSRAAYPCMKVAFPIATVFITYIITILATLFSFKWAKRSLMKKQYALSSLLFITAFLSLTILLGITNYKSNAFTLSTTIEAPNDPIGVAKGVNPGRVVWAYDNTSTNENCTNEGGDYWFLDTNTDPVIVSEMISDSIQALTDSTTDYDSWDKIFRYFNNDHGKGDIGYSSGEKIAIKINLTSSDLGVDKNHAKKDRIEMIDTSPQVILAVLDQLINVYNINEENIYIGDPHRNFYKRLYDSIYAKFPNVVFLDFDGGNNRTKTEYSAEPVIHYADSITQATTRQTTPDTTSDRLAQQYIDADYMINIPCLKAHSGSGVSMAAKNHFGSQSNHDADHLHYALPAYTPGMNKYRNLVDLMGHKDLGGKTVIYIIDALYGYYDWGAGPPEKFVSFGNDWTSSIFISQDPVAIESVGTDFLKDEYTGGYPYMDGADDYLHQAADSANWPVDIWYDPENDGSNLTSLGVHEHWNNSTDKQYSKNLGTGNGIELVSLLSSNPITKISSGKSAYSSSNYSAGYSVDKINDNDLSTLWGAGIADSKPYAYIDLSDDYTLDKIIVNWDDTYFATEYKLGAKIGNKWITADVTGDGGIDELDISAYNVKTRYVGIQCINGSTGYYGIKEFEIYGSK